MQHSLNNLKQLTTEQYETCRQTAIERVKQRVGSRPTRKDFQREMGPLWGPLDVLALVVFVAAFVISSLHIMQFVETSVGADHGVGYVRVNQLGYIFLAEAAMVLFMVMHGMTASRRRDRPALLRPLSIYMLLSVLAGTFIFVANLASGVGLLLSLMPPAFTVGISFNLERLIIASLKRRDEINRRYEQAIADYEAAAVDPEQHSKFNEFVAQAIWDKIVSLKINRVHIDAPPGFRVAAVRRELAREQWMHADPMAEYVQEQQAAEPVPFGATREIRDDHAFTPMTAHANGHGGIVTAPNN